MKTKLTNFICKITSKFKISKQMQTLVTLGTESAYFVVFQEKNLFEVVFPKHMPELRSCFRQWYLSENVGTRSLVTLK